MSVTSKDTGQQPSASGDLSEVVTCQGESGAPGSSLAGLRTGGLSVLPQEHVCRVVSGSPHRGAGIRPVRGSRQSKERATVSH